MKTFVTDLLVHYEGIRKGWVNANHADRKGAFAVSTRPWRLISPASADQEDPILGLLDHCCAALSNEGRYLAYRELDKQDGLWLHLFDRDLNRFARQPWPKAEALREQAPRFSHDGSELWWIAPEQGPGLPELMHRMANPFFMPDRR